MRVRNPKKIYISNEIIREFLMAVKDGAANVAPFSINNLRTELHQLSKIWLKTGKIIYTSGSKVSAVQSERLAIKAFYKLKCRVHSFAEYNREHGTGHIYGYEFTINPSKLTYKNVADVNSKIIHELKKSSKIALIQKAIEHTYYRDAINLHCHYLVVATGRINIRNTYRRIKAVARKSTNGNVNKTADGSKPYRRVTNWTKAEDYVTKQQGKFPLMMIHSQYQRFMRLPLAERLDLLARDYNESKGVEIHRFYVNSKNEIAKRWHKKTIDHNHCRKDGTLVYIRKHSGKMSRLSAFSKLSDKIHGKWKRTLKRGRSKHHYSEIEAMSVFYGHGVYYFEHQSQRVQTVSLF